MTATLRRAALHCCHLLLSARISPLLLCCQSVFLSLSLVFSLSLQSRGLLSRCLCDLLSHHQRAGPLAINFPAPTLTLQSASRIAECGHDDAPVLVVMQSSSCKSCHDRLLPHHHQLQQPSRAHLGISHVHSSTGLEVAVHSTSSKNSDAVGQ